FLVGWGFSFLWGPIADRFGRTRALAATILVYSLFTGLAAFATTVWQLGVFRLLAGVGVGGEWAMAGTYVAEAWPEDRRKMGAGAVYEPTAITTLARQAGMSAPAAARMVSLATAVLSTGTILGCLSLPVLAERWGRRRTLALYFSGMMVTIPLAFGWAFHRTNGLVPFVLILFFMGFAGG